MYNLFSTNGRFMPCRQPRKRGSIKSLFAPLAAVILALAGCATLGERVVRQQLPPETPEVETILNDLAANDAAIKTFRAAGTFWLESPQLTGAKKFGSGGISFRRPADLYIVGRNELNMPLFRVTSVGSEFLIDFPASKDEPYYQFEGAQFQSVPFSVSPSDIAREMFLPEDWSALKPRQVRIRTYDPATQTALLEIGPRHTPRRLISVQGAPWVATRNELLDKDGNIVAVTTKERYFASDGIRFPALIDAYFPGEQTRMKFDMRNIKINVKIGDDKFDIDGRARELRIDLKKARKQAQQQEVTK